MFVSTIPLSVGVKLKDVYNHGLQYVKSHKPELVDKLTKNFGLVHTISFHVSMATIN